MKLLVCGSRLWANRQFLYKVLDALHEKEKIQILIEGESRGADAMARDWAVKNKVSLRKFPAKWDSYGNGAGPVRNQLMLDKGAPDRVLAFHNDIAGSRGTKDMVKKSLAAMVPVLIVSENDKPERIWWK
jgi:hypothetical protein